MGIVKYDGMEKYRLMEKSTNKTVCVLMSTYNGGKYVSMQIDSILAQEGVDITLIVRDDGSNDNTTLILDEYKSKGLLTWYSGANKGPAYSFWDLLLRAGDYKYYAFADQDDVWLKEKICAAVEKIKLASPFLYFSKKTLVDNDLNEMNRKDDRIRGTSLEFSLLRGFASGCTMVFNDVLYKELVKYTPEVMTMHDSWILKVAGAIGEIYYDPISYILYRQHGRNTIGNQTRLTIARRHLRNGIKYRYDNDRSKMAGQLVNIYGTMMDARDIKHSKWLANIRISHLTRWKMAFSTYYKTQRPSEIILLKLGFLLGWM